MVKKCPSCGTKNDDETIFCYQCGHEVDKPLPKRTQTNSQTSGGIQIWPLTRKARRVVIFLILLQFVVFLVFAFINYESGLLPPAVSLEDKNLDDMRVYAINGSILFAAESMFMDKNDVIYVRLINLTLWDFYRVHITEYYSDNGSLWTSKPIDQHHEGNFTFEYEFMDKIGYGGRIEFTLWHWEIGNTFLRNLGHVTLNVQV